MTTFWQMAVTAAILGFGKLLFAHAAHRAEKILREIFKLSAGRNTVVGITDSFVVNPTANFADVLFHRFLQMEFIVRF